MNNVIKNTDKYIKNLSVCDLGLIKICLLSLGLLFGMSIPKKAKKNVRKVSLFTFLITYIVVMSKFVYNILNDEKSI